MRQTCGDARFLKAKEKPEGNISSVQTVVAGLFLLLLGLSVSPLLFNATRTDVVIDVSFVLAPGEKYEPYEKGTYHHTRIISNSVLLGEVLIKDGGVNFTASGYNTQHLKNVLINRNYSFIIDPADDLYTFTFDNRAGTVQNSISFILKETWLDTLSQIFAFVIALVSLPLSIDLLVMRRREKNG